MKLKEIHIENFRNYENLSIRPNPKVNVFFGKNASGKTNILEAISMLISGKSFRTHRDRETLKFGQDSFTIKALIEREGLEKDYEMEYRKDRTKKIQINLSKVQSLKELRRKSPLVVFTPEDLDIIKKGPNLRRRFFDQAIGSIDLVYRYNLQKFNQILRQKNELLKDRNYKLKQNILFDSYNIQLASLAAYLVWRRKTYIEEISQPLYKMHMDISQGEEIKIIYKNKHGHLEDIKDIEKSILEEYRESLSQDLFRRTSTSGPQRDDYEIYLDKKLARHYASQGQQRNAILTMKLIEMKMIKSYIRLSPILLLDDVFSELDKNRRKKLIDYIKDSQVFISIADINYLKDFLNIDSNIYLVKNDKLELINGGNNVRETSKRV